MKKGILLINTGTPDEPTPQAVKRYLAEFLSDPRIVKIPRFIWLPILHGIILRTRPAKSAALYDSIWTPEGSPLRVYMLSIAEKLRTQLALPVAVGMNYGHPSIQSALTYLHDQGVSDVICLPLFPQYSHTSTSSAKDRVALALKKTHLPLNTRWIESYAAHPAYIAALKESVQSYWQRHGKADKLLISYHGIPERFVKEGDPYQTECETTTALLVEALNLKHDDYILCYQSQFGYDKWLKPSTQQGIKSADVICPGFSVDCLETLEEIAKRGAEDWHLAGGEQLCYIPTLNDTDAQIELLTQLCHPHESGDPFQYYNGFPPTRE
jgi:ferrochelatase